MKKWLCLFLAFLLISCGVFKYEAGNSRKYAFNIEISDLNTSDAKDNEAGNLSFKIVNSLCLLDSQDAISDIELNATSINLGLTNTGIIKQPKNLLDDKSKKDAYNMRSKSTIRKEWYEQIEAIEDSIINKKINQLGVDVLEKENIKAKATIKLDPYLISINHSTSKIVDLNKDIYKVVSASKSDINILTKANTKTEGKGIVSSYYAVIFLDDKMKIMDIVTDKIEQPFNFDHLGKWKNIVAVASKQEQLDYSQYKGLSVEELLAKLDTENEYSQVIKLSAEKLSEK